MVLSSLGIVTVLKPSFGYKLCAELAREGYERGTSLHDIVMNERKLLTQEKWDEIFSFENLIHPVFGSRSPERRSRHARRVARALVGPADPFHRRRGLDLLAVGGPGRAIFR